MSLKQHSAGERHLRILEMQTKRCKASSLINRTHQNSNGIQEKSKLVESVVEGTTKKTPLTGYLISYIPLNHTSKKPKIPRFICDVCNFEAPDQGFLDLHSTIEHRHQGVPDQSNKLIRKLHKSKESYNYYCDICHVKGYTLSLSEHLAGKKHLEMKSKHCKAPSLINGANQNSNGLQEKSKQYNLIEFSDHIKSKLEIKDEPIDMKNEISEKPKLSRFYCKVCNFQSQTKFEFEIHFSGMKHLKST